MPAAYRGLASLFCRWMLLFYVGFQRCCNIKFRMGLPAIATTYDETLPPVPVAENREHAVYAQLPALPALFAIVSGSNSIVRAVP